MKKKKAMKKNDRTLTFLLSREINKNELALISGGANAFPTCTATGSGGSNGGSLDTTCDI